MAKVECKLPIVALAFVVDKVNYQAVGLHLFIDGEHVHVHHQQYHAFNVAEDHVLLCDLRVLFSDEGWGRLDARVGHGNEWKRVQVKCETDMILIHWEVYVYKKETNMDDMSISRVAGDKIVASHKYHNDTKGCGGGRKCNDFFKPRGRLG